MDVLPQEIEDKCKVILNPHTLRLIRLIQYPSQGSSCHGGSSSTNEFADHAARMLGQVTSESSPLVLWDILGRLRHLLLHSPLWNTRQCASFAMTLVAQHLPIKDQQEFMSGTNISTQDEDDASLLWLTVHDLAATINGATISIDAVLSKGRLLLSQLESFYDVVDKEDDEQQICTVEDSILNTLDAKAIAIAGSSSSAQTTIPFNNANSISSLFDARVQYQRSIMARRLGLAHHDDDNASSAAGLHMSHNSNSFAQNFVARELLSHGFLTDYITQQDIIATNNNTIAAAREEEAAKTKKKKSKRKPKTTANEDLVNQKDSTATINSKTKNAKKRTSKQQQQQQQQDDNDGEHYGTVRALLVLEMRSNHNNTTLSSKSHSRPRTLLATDLLFSMFHPNWSVRHGACLGILALCKAWLPSTITTHNNNNNNNNNVLVFGSWLHDILARSVCILALDRFGDFSDDDNINNINEGGGGGGVIAPVRQVASQLLAFLWKIAPYETQVQTLRLLQRMVKMEQKQQQQCWEVRHGSMLAFLYICASSSSIPSFRDNTYSSRKSNNNINNNSLCYSRTNNDSQLNDSKSSLSDGYFDVLSIASRGLVDESDDVRAVSSRVILQLLLSSSAGRGNHNNPIWREAILSLCSTPLWQALRDARSVSSCVADLLLLLERIITLDAHSVVQKILHSALNNNNAATLISTVATKTSINAAIMPTVLDNSTSPLAVFNVTCQILEKLIDFLDYDYMSCQVSSLDVLAKVREPICALTNSLIKISSGHTNNIKNGNQHEEEEKAEESNCNFSLGLSLVSIICNLLIKIYNSFWDTTQHANSDPKYQRKYRDARDRCWRSLVEAVTPCQWDQQFTQMSSFTRVINEMYGTLILSYFGIQIVDHQSAPSHSSSSMFGTESRTTQVSLSKEKNCIKRREHQEDDTAYERQLQGATALTQLSTKLFECNMDKSSNLIRRKLNSTAEDTLHLFLQVMLESPWQDLAEAGILLYTATASKSVQNLAMLTFLDDHDRIMGSKSETFIRMLQQSTPYCSRLQHANPQGEPLLTCDTTRSAVCDEILVSAVQSLLFYRTSAESDSTSDLPVAVSVANKVVKVWKSFFDCRTGGTLATNESSSSATTLKLMRIRCEMSCAIISRGISYMPTQLTPVIQSLMTSLQHEKSRPRQNVCSCNLADLVLLLSNRELHNTGTVDVQQLQRRQGTCKKVVASVCALVYAHATRAPIDVVVELTSGNNTNAAERMISRLIAKSRSSESTELSLLSSELDPLASAEDGYVNGDKITQILYLLKVVSESIHDSPSALNVLSGKLLHPVSLIACNSPSAFSRQLAVISVKNFCVASSSKCFPIVLPIVFDSLRDLGDDARRFGAGRLLHSIVESLGIQICPFIKCILPAVMSSLNDPLDDCARTAASTFAFVVRAAPLVIDDQLCRKNHDTNIINQDSPSTAAFQVGELPKFFENDDESSDKVIDHLVHGKPLPTYPLPPELTAAMKGVQLREYQMEGVSWIRFLASVHLNGVLADDMGLGKTLQALVAIGVSHFSGNMDGKVLPSLVVCPSTVAGHWAGEIERFFTSDLFKTWSYVGSAKKRREDCNIKLSDCNIVVTSYAVLRNDVEWLSSKRWNYVILDEGHLLKNPKTATAKAARALKCKHKLLLSGTPVQNRCQEIWAIFDFLMPNFLGAESNFFKQFAKPIGDGHMPGASADEVGKSMEKLKLLHQQVLPFILRREKGQVLKELPPKIVTDVLCELSSEQRSLYQMLSAKPETKDALEHLRLGITRGQGLGNDCLQKDLWSALKSLMLLRLLCTHPTLVVSSMARRKTCDDRDVKRRQRHTGKSVSLFPPEKMESLHCSGKLVALNDLLRSAGVYSSDITGADNDVSCIYVEDEDRSGQVDASFSNYDVDEGSGTRAKDSRSPKCLIFAQFSRSLDVVEKYLFQPHMPSLRYHRLDGKVPLERRTEVVNQFNSDDSIRVMLLTTKVGGLGLNLSAAQLVVLLESDWNPHNDLQAIDRAHRIGQKGTLQVYRLISKDTVEEKIMKLQDQKMAMSEAIVNTENSSMFSMGTDRLLDLFTFEAAESSDDKSESPCLNFFEDYEVEEKWFDEEYSSLAVKEFFEVFKQ